jgi:hypothetical protein
MVFIAVSVSGFLLHDDISVCSWCRVSYLRTKSNNVAAP